LPDRRFTVSLIAPVLIYLCQWKMNEIREKKALLRKKILQLRSSTDPGTLAELSERIRLRLEEHQLWRTSRFACIYISSKPGEVDTQVLIRSALEEGKKVCVPVIDPEDAGLGLVEIDRFDNLQPGYFGILEPSNGVRQPFDSIDWDLAVVPGIAFDPLGHRIGFGKGYYDKLLAAKDSPKVGLAFSFQMVEPFETLAHDVAMDLIITENETIQPA
jgi:5-formyltetrahydrofolate cyclo-ligase